jgi:hypothetical protein
LRSVLKLHRNPVSLFQPENLLAKDGNSVEIRQNVRDLGDYSDLGVEK